MFTSSFVFFLWNEDSFLYRFDVRCFLIPLSSLSVCMIFCCLLDLVLSLMHVFDLFAQLSQTFFVFLVDASSFIHEG